MFNNPLFKILKFFITPYTLNFTAAAIAVSAYSARKGRKAAQGAAATQAAAADRASEEQRRQFDISRKQAEPFRQAGLAALGQQQALMGLKGVGAQQQAFEQFQESPGQAFLRERGEQALLRQSAAIGGLGGGQVRSELQRQGIGFAQQDLQNQLARLGAMAGQGQAVTGNVAQLGANMATQVGQQQIQAGQALASGQLGAAQAQNRFMGSIGSGLMGAGMASGQGMSALQGFQSGFSKF